MSNLYKFSVNLCRFRCTALVAALALVGVSSEAGAAPPGSETAPMTVRVVIDASALGPDAAYFENEIAKRVSEGLVAEGFQVVERGRSTVRIKLDFFDERDRDFLIATDVVRDGRMAVSQQPAKCPACVDDELVDAALAMLPELVEALRANPEQFPTENPENPPSGDGAGDVEPTTTIAPIGPVGIGGAVIAGFGLGALIGGVVELSRGEVRNDDPTMLDSIGRDHTPPGKALVGVGAGALVVGAVMLGVDLGLRAKKRQKSRQASVLPVLGPGNAGLVLQGRF